MTPVAQIFEPIRQAVGARTLMAFLAELDQDLSGFAASRRGFLSQLADYVLTGSGKRVRPGLVFLASQFGRARAEAVKETALAVEMIHIATLVHDDLVDQAVMRRQKPTVAVQFGGGAAVLLGDYVYAQAFQRLSVLGDPALLELFSATTMSMCEGEIEQLERRYDFNLSEAEYLVFLEKKTASLMAASCRAGAHLAGLPVPQQRALETFGHRVGLAFQIVDDILDLEGEESLTGKTLRTDLMYGKMTLPLIHFGSRLKTAADRDAFLQILKNPNGQVSDLIRLVHDAGSMEYSRAKVRDLLAQAEEALALLPDHPSRSLLTDIARRLSDRQV